MIRRTILPLGLVAIMGLAGLAPVQAADVILTHQGRLLDAGDQPVTGTVSITFRIFEAPTGGAPLWTEMHPAVSVESGLFIAQLGETIPLPVDVLSPIDVPTPVRWLEIEVNGDILVPRQRLGTTPSAASTGRVSGDISTAPGAVTMSRMSGSTTGTIRMAANPDSTGLTLESDSDGDGIPESFTSSFGVSPRSGSLSVSIEGDARAGLRTAVTPDSVVEELSIDEAGLPVAGSSMTVNDRSVARQWAGHSGSTTGTIRMAVSPDSTESVLGLDSDGDGVIDNSITQTSTDADAGLNLRYRSGTRVFCGVADRTATGHLSGMSGSTTGTIRMAASPDSTESVLEQDSDGDGVVESSVSSKTKGTKASGGYVGGMMGSTTGTIRLAASPDSSESLLGQDSDGNGAPESSVSSKTKGTRATGALSGMMGSTTGTIRMAASPDSSTTALDSDTNNDGIPESSVKAKTSGPRATSILSGMSGSTTGTIRMSAMPESTMTILGTDTNADAIPENLIIHKSKGTQAGSTLSGMSGSTTATIRMQAAGVDQQGTTSGALSLDVTSPGGSGTVEAFADLIDSYVHLTEDGVRSYRASSTTGMELRDASDVATCTIDRNGNGYLSTKLGIGKTPIEKIDVDGGAYCDGTNWVNASDADAKENFRDVDGEALLRQLAKLDITEWNYKGDEGTTHIGPTAQDFKKSFGVGSNDKSISTIDPSGIALAAIKELYSQLKAKDQQLQIQSEQIEELQHQLAKIQNRMKQQ